MSINRDLFLGELRRFRLLAALLAAAHLLVLLFLNRMTDMQQQPHEVERLFMAVYMAGAFALGLYQLGVYRRPSRWLWLLHRPLPHRAICFSIVAAAAVLLLVAVTLPRLLMLAGVDLLTPRLVDSHHYLMPLHAWVLACMAWVAGVCTVLSPRPLAIVVAIIPVWLMWSFAASLPLLMLEITGLVWLLAVAVSQFKPDREAPVRHPLLVVLGALPLQIGIGYALVVAAIGYEFLLMFAGRHSLNMPVPPSGGYTESQRMEPRELLATLLKLSADPRAPAWSEALARADGPWGPELEFTRLREYPVRHQAYQRRPLQWVDDKRHIEWTFSHDDLLFHGHDTRSGRAQGRWGVGGVGDLRPFPAVPLVIEQRFLMTSDRLYAIDRPSQASTEVLRLPPGEVFIAPPVFEPDGAHLIVVSSGGLRVHALAQGRAGAPLVQLQLPGLPFMQPMQTSSGHGSLSRLDHVKLGDGWLFGLTFGGFYKGEAIRQLLVHAAPDGRSEVMASRPISGDFGMLYENVAWWLSPLQYALRELPHRLGEGRQLPAELLPARPARVVVAALLLHLTALALTLWWLRGSSLSTGRRALWLAMVMPGGLPAALSLLLLERRTVQRPAPALQAALQPA
ncbi:hypothetical protein ACS5PK_10375 [Roseateles sp. DB2]|uniref:hypothetical protein n=1 Tax=Roseateles sp. DB2 TaxID=3453717 RepID=UPI003EEE1879